jgi:trigger factor
MKATVETLNSVQRRIQVELPADAVNSAFEDAYRRIQKKAHLQGFRPGKAPLNLIKKFYGGSVASEVGEKLVNQNVFKVISENKINMVAAPVLEKADLPTNDKEFHFTVVVDVMPEISLPDIKGLEVTCESFTVTDEAIAKQIDELRKRSAKKKPLAADVVAAKGHSVKMKIKAFREDGSEIKGLPSDEIDTVLGESQLVAEIEQALHGMKAGETRETTVKLPDNFADQQMAGKSMKYQISVTEVAELQLPEADDELAKDFDFESLAKMKDNIRERMTTQMNQQRRSTLEEKVLEKLLERAPFEVPPSLVDEAIDGMIKEQFSGLEGPELKKAMFDENLRKELRPSARRRTQNSLMLVRIAQDQKIEVTGDDVRNHIQKQYGAAANRAETSLDSLVKLLGDRVKQALLFEKALDLLIGSAKVKEIPAKA